MKVYKPKALIPGWKLRPEHQGKTYVAVNNKIIDRGCELVAFGNKLMSIKSKEPVMSTGPWEDKFGGLSYWLYYYEWKPKKLVIGEKII